jgi:hypothetical protein
MSIITKVLVLTLPPCAPQAMAAGGVGGGHDEAASRRSLAADDRVKAIEQSAVHLQLDDRQAERDVVRAQVCDEPGDGTA